MALGVLYDTDELAALLRVKPRTVEDWRLDGKGPKYKRLGGPRGPVRYREADVEAWLEESPVVPASA